MKQILMVEDDTTLNKMLSNILLAEGYKVTSACTVAEACQCFQQAIYDLVVLDINLPDGSGYEVCKIIKEKAQTPVIFLTANDLEQDMIKGYELGAADYITKPFRPRELIARMGAAMRKNSRSARLELAGLSVDTASGIVEKNGSEISLSSLEYRLLLVFLGAPKSILTRGRLLDELWDAAGEFVNDNTLTVYIKRLREKIEDDPSHPKIILTVRGMGYRLGEANAAE